MATYIEQRVQQVFAEEGVSPAPGSIERIAGEIATGQRTIMDVTRDVRWVRNHLENNPDANDDPGGHTLTRSPSGDGGSTGGETPAPEASSRNWQADAQALYPWLTPGLLNEFASKWADTGNASLALAYVRNTSEYARVFPGIKRDDGSLRMSENEYFSTKAAFTETLAEFGRDPSQYQSRYADLFQRDVSAQEFYRAVESATQRFVEPGSERDNGLVDAYLGAFFETGSAEAALERARDSSAYDNVFAGNRREDGTLRMDEPEYFAYMRGWDRLFLSRGLNPEPFRARNRHVEAIEAELSIQELDGRINAVEQGILGNRQEVNEWFTQQYGQGWSQAVDSVQSALAMAIDPEVGQDLLARRITAAQIGGEAAVQGYVRSIERAEELARAGVGQGEARQLYSDAAGRLRGLSATTRRFNRGGTNLSAFEDAMILGDADEQTRIERALRSEQSSFTNRLDTRAERGGFGLVGLRQR